MSLIKRYHTNWVFQTPDAIMTCSVINHEGLDLIIFGGHDKTLFLIDLDLQIVDDISFDGWARCTYPLDLEDDGSDEILVGTGNGNILVLKLNKKTNELFGIMNYKAKGKINICVAGDLYRDGNIELIFGGEDKVLQIFKDIHSIEPMETLYYDSWVMACALGAFKLPRQAKPVYGLVVGTKNGMLQMIQIKNAKPDILWQIDLKAQINDIQVGDVTNDGYNDIIIGMDDSHVKILDAGGNIVKYLKTPNTRPLALLIADIDGDNVKEICIGCADGSFRVYENPILNSKNFNLKWKMKVATSITSITSIWNKDDKARDIILGGYDRTIRNIRDFEWGKKKPLKIPVKIRMPARVKSKSEDPSQKRKEIKIIPTNLRDFIVFLFQKMELFVNHDILKNELMEHGFSDKEISEELKILKNAKVISLGALNIDVWQLNEELLTDLRKAEKERKESIELQEDNLDETQVKREDVIDSNSLDETQAKSEDVIDSNVLDETQAKSEDVIDSNALEKMPGKDLVDVILKILREKELVAKKSDFINSIKAQGFNIEAIEAQIEVLKNENIIKYSRSIPQGWSIVK